MHFLRTNKFLQIITLYVFAFITVNFSLHGQSHRHSHKKKHHTKQQRYSGKQPVKYHSSTHHKPQQRQKKQSYQKPKHHQKQQAKLHYKPQSNKSPRKRLPAQRHKQAQSRRFQAHSAPLNNAVLAQRASAVNQALIQQPKYIKSVKLLNNVPVKMNYAHLITPVVTNQGGKKILTGFHHDQGKRLMSQGVYQLKNVRQLGGGAYTGKISIYNKNYGTKSFFPVGWDDKKLSHKIIEAANNPLKKPKWDAQKKSWTVVGKTSEGVKIQSIIAQNGFVVTSYPV